MKNVIYCATSKTTGKAYVGQTSREFDIRKGEHIKAGQAKTNNAFHNAIYELGADDFEWEVLEELPDETKLLDREVYWSYQRNAYIPNGYSPVPGSIAGQNSKPVICLETGDIFMSAGDAAVWAGLKSGLSQALALGRAAGYIPGTTTKAHWDYVNPEHRKKMNEKYAKKSAEQAKNNAAVNNSSGLEAIYLAQINLLQSQVDFYKSRLAKYEKI